MRRREKRTAAPILKALKAPSPERSRQMSLVRSRGNKSTETRFVAFLREQGITGWRRHVALPGRPDFCFRSQRLVVFVDGCFWHGCPKCQRRLPVSNLEFWRSKIASNIRRDQRNFRTLRREGWRVYRVWEHALNHDLSPQGRILRALRTTQPGRLTVRKKHD